MDTPLSALPPMVITYRLAGVDGEATEDQVETLVDPEEPISSASPDEEERLLDQQYGITRIVTEKKSSISVLVKAIQTQVRNELRKIRRDDVVVGGLKAGGILPRSERNASLASFLSTAPSGSLTLLLHVSKLPSNRKRLVEARAPTLLLRLLLDVLNAIDDPTERDSGSDAAGSLVSNPTAELLEELIATLASDISAEEDEDGDAEEEQGTSTTLPLLLSSLKTIYLGPPLRKVIAKLLPFLTYGQVSLSKELAEHFCAHIPVESLAECEQPSSEHQKTRKFVTMDTFVQAAVNLPPTDVCNCLRSELGPFTRQLVRFVAEGLPSSPPPWTAALWSSSAHQQKEQEKLQMEWKHYFCRKGVKTALEMLMGICRGHQDTQSLIATVSVNIAPANEKPKEKPAPFFLQACHWIESTSDNKNPIIQTQGMGILAETLLDELKEENPSVSKKIGEIRRRTRERKKEIAQDRRRKALGGMGVVGNSAAAAAASGSSSSVGEFSLRSGLSLLSNFLGGSGSTAPPGAPKDGIKKSKKGGKQPAWLAEMEALEDEKGLTCAVCQEGRTLQPSELLGLYAYVKKVSIQPNKCGDKNSIEGSVLLANLPTFLPDSLKGTTIESNWFKPAREVGVGLKDLLDASSSYNSASSSGSRRASQFTTTVSSRNAIHCSCHAKAKSADRNHPKAPKSEWEGASLRNSRVSCNIILPLVSSESSKVPLMAVEMALADYQTVVSHLMGARPKAILWAVLHDVRLLLLRIAYGEPLNSDCGGGSLASNTSLLFYQLFLADMFTDHGDHDDPKPIRLARALSGGYLATQCMLEADDYKHTNETTLSRGIADSAPMASLCCILYHNTSDEDNLGAKNGSAPHPRRRWQLYKNHFLRGLISCAGRRHALGVEDSGCLSTRGGKAALRTANAFINWESESSRGGSSSSSSAGSKRSAQLHIDDFALALRPMIVLFAVLDKISEVFVVNMADELVDESTQTVVAKVDECHKSKNIHELLKVANITMDHDEIIEYLQKGMVSA